MNLRDQKDASVLPPTCSTRRQLAGLRMEPVGGYTSRAPGKNGANCGLPAVVSLGIGRASLHIFLANEPPICGVVGNKHAITIVRCGWWYGGRYY